MMKVCSEWLWLIFVTFFDGLGPKMNHFGGPQTSPFSGRSSLRGPRFEYKVRHSGKMWIQSLPDSPNGSKLAPHLIQNSTLRAKVLSRTRRRESADPFRGHQAWGMLSSPLSPFLAGLSFPPVVLPMGSQKQTFGGSPAGSC